MLSEYELDSLQPGTVYRDIDGTLVQLLAIKDSVCCWVPIDKGWNDRQYTLLDHFTRRFRNLSEAA